MGELSGYPGDSMQPMPPSSAAPGPVDAGARPADRLACFHALANRSSMLGLVVVCFFITNRRSNRRWLRRRRHERHDWSFDPMITLPEGLPLRPFLLLFFYLRRPKLTHTVQAYPTAGGAQLHALSGGMVVKSPQPTAVQHHLFR